MGVPPVTHAAQVSKHPDNIVEIYLHVQTSNEAAINFYASFGFEKTEMIPNYYKVRAGPTLGLGFRFHLRCSKPLVAESNLTSPHLIHFAK